MAVVFQYVLRGETPDALLGISLNFCPRAGGDDRVYIKVTPAGFVAAKNRRIRQEAWLIVDTLAELALCDDGAIEFVNGRHDKDGICEQLRSSDVIHMTVRRTNALVPQALLPASPLPARPLLGAPQAALDCGPHWKDIGMQDLTAQQAPLEAHLQPHVQPPAQAHTQDDWDSWELFPIAVQVVDCNHCGRRKVGGH